MAKNVSFSGEQNSDQYWAGYNVMSDHFNDTDYTEIIFSLIKDAQSPYPNVVNAIETDENQEVADFYLGLAEAFHRCTIDQLSDCSKKLSPKQYKQFYHQAMELISMMLTMGGYFSGEENEQNSEV